MSIYLLPRHYSTEPVSPGALVEARGEWWWQQFRKLTPPSFNFPFILEPLSFTPRLACNEGLDVGLGLG